MNQSQLDRRETGLPRRHLLWLVLLWLVVRPGGSAAMEYHLGLVASDMVYAQRNYLDSAASGFSRDRDYNLLTVSPLLDVSLSGQAFILLSGDLEWTYEPDTAAEGYSESEVTGVWTAASLTLGDRPIQLCLGVQAMKFGTNLITVDEVPAVRLTAAAGRWSLDLQAARIMEQSPMAGLDLGFRPGPFESVNFFGAWYRDEENALAASLPDLYQVLDPTSSGELWWAGVTAQLFLGKILMSATAVYEQGDIRFEHLLGQTRRDVAAYLMDVGLEVNAGDQVSLGLFLFTASGDDDLRDDTLESFVSPLPYNTRATIFFDPEWLDRYIDEEIIYGGATVHGVVAPGGSITLAPIEALLMTGRVAIFYPQVNGPEGRNWYGWEADLDISYTLTDNFELFAQAARFEHGDYFENSQGDAPEPSLLFAIGGRMFVR